MPNLYGTSRALIHVLRGLALGALVAAVRCANATEVPGEDSYQRYDGEAYSPRDGSLLYTEQHLVRSRGERVAERLVLYACSDGRPFARKLVRYVASPFAPDLRFDDARSGVFNAIETTPSGRRVVAREGPDGREITAPVPPGATLVADAGFDEFVRRRWDELLSARPVPFDILLPSDGSVLHLKARHLRSAIVDGEPTEVFRVTLAGLLGLVAPNIDVYYTAHDHALRRFDGISNIRDRRGRSIRAVIEFPPGRRHSSDATAWRTSLIEPLVSECAN